MFLILLMFKSASLKAQDKITLPVGSKITVDYSDIEIVLNLPDSNILGYAPSDTINYRTKLKPLQNITEWLNIFKDKQFLTSKDVKAKKLLWVFHDLSVGKNSSGNNNTSFVKLKSDIYESGDNSSYTVIKTFDSTWISNDKAGFGQMITNAFLELYSHTINKNSHGNPSSVRYKNLPKVRYGSKDEIADLAKSKQGIPVLKDNFYKSGIYLSFSEFKNNEASVSQFYADVDALTNEVNLYEILPDSSFGKVENAWGVAVNNEVYFYSGRQLYPVEKWGNTFFISKYLDFRKRKNQGLYWRRYIGAKQGDNNPFNDAHILKRSVPVNPETELEATHLDLDTEDFTY